MIPSVQGLDSKVLKNNLKKENCYTTVMTTARIRGVEKVYVTDVTGTEQNIHRITDDMTFAHLLAAACQRERVSLDLLNNWYLFDTGKGGLSNIFLYTYVVLMCCHDCMCTYILYYWLGDC